MRRLQLRWAVALKFFFYHGKGNAVLTFQAQNQLCLIFLILPSSSPVASVMSVREMHRPSSAYPPQALLL